MCRSEPRSPAASGRLARGIAPAATLAAVLAAAALAAGCAAPRPGPAAKQEDAWSGRFAASWTPASQPPSEERASGRFSLRSAADRTELEVFSPFGQTVARVLSRPQGALLETADGRRFEAPDVEALTESVLGWRVPLNLLVPWLLGERPDHAVEAGWEMRVDARDAGRPSRLTLKWPGEFVQSSWRQVTIRLIVDAPDDAATSR